MKTFILAALASTALAGSVSAQEVVLKLHHFLSAESPTHADFLVPWEKAVEEQSGGRIDVQIYPSMQLGGKPPQLFDQARDGIVDLAWTLPGYTPGRFPNTEAFELPFVAGNATDTTRALQQFQEKYLTEELGDVHPILVHGSTSYKLHLAGKDVAAMAELSGLKVRTPNRSMTDALNTLGASAIGMPVPEVPQALTTGVIDGAVLPWEVFGSLRIEEVAKNHVEFGQENGGMSSSVFMFVMNKAKYDSLPDDLKKVIDDNSGSALVDSVGGAYDSAEAAQRQKAVDAGGTITVLPEDEVTKWREATQPVVDGWAEAHENGQAMVDDARAMMTEAQGK